MSPLQQPSSIAKLLASGILIVTNPLLCPRRQDSCTWSAEDGFEHRRADFICCEIFPGNLVCGGALGCRIGVNFLETVNGFFYRRKTEHTVSAGNVAGPSSILYDGWTSGGQITCGAAA